MHEDDPIEQVKRADEAVELARPLTTPKHRLTLAKALANLGTKRRIAFEKVGGIERMNSAREHLLEAIEIAEEIKDKGVVDGPFLFLPNTSHGLSKWHHLMGNRDERDRVAQQAHDALERMATVHTDSVPLQQLLATSYWNAGEYDRTFEVEEKLAKENPLVTSYQVDLAYSYGRLSTFRRQEGGRDREAVELAANSLNIYQRLADEYPEREQFRNSLAVAHKDLAWAQRSAGKLDEAIKSSEAAIEILKETRTIVTYSLMHIRT